MKLLTFLLVCTGLISCATHSVTTLSPVIKKAENMKNDSTYVQDPHSNCRVKRLPGEFGEVKIEKLSEFTNLYSEIYTLPSDVVGPILFSPSGRAIAFGNGEYGQFSFGKHDDYRVLVFYCQTAETKAYFRGGELPRHGEQVSYTYVKDLQWSNDEKHLSGIDVYSDEKTRKFKIKIKQ